MVLFLFSFFIYFKCSFVFFFSALQLSVIHTGTPIQGGEVPTSRLNTIKGEFKLEKSLNEGLI
jgi:hypothetical protein